MTLLPTSSFAALGCILCVASIPACSDSSDGKTTDNTSSVRTEAGAGSGGGGARATSAGGRGGAGQASRSDAGRGGAGGGTKPTQPGTAAGGGGSAGQGEAGDSADSSSDAGTADTNLVRSNAEADTSPDISDADYATFVSHLNRFGLDLGQQLADTNQLTQQNIVYSPLSASYALSMTYAGASGSTADEFKTVLGDTFPAGVFHQGANRLARELASRATSRMATDGNAHKLELNLADGLFLERSFELEPAFLDVLGSQYDAGIFQEDFLHAPDPSRVQINDWVSDQTHGKITNLLAQGSITEQTRLVLVNALYFYGTWLRTFDPSQTRAASFQPLSGAAVQVPTMHGELQAQYRASDDFALAELPYEGNHVRMTIVLPVAGKFESVRSQVTQAWLDQAVSGLTAKTLQVALPKFKLTVGAFDLTSGLQALGLKQAFTDAADFSGMSRTGQLSISGVVQKAFIAVDENGTEAAAATAVVVGTTAVIESIPFVVDRPFLFFIRDDSGAVLFSGQVVDPSRED